jgi:hypothetical protein
MREAAQKAIELDQPLRSRGCSARPAALTTVESTCGSEPRGRSTRPEGRGGFRENVPLRAVGQLPVAHRRRRSAAAQPGWRGQERSLARLPRLRTATHRKSHAVDAGHVTHPLSPLAHSLEERAVRYVLIGVSGANLYGPGGQAVFATDDFDLFLPLDPDNLARAWSACEDKGLDLWLANEPLDRPRDRRLAEQIIERRVLTRAAGADELAVDLTLVMQGFDFESVWAERRVFRIDGVGVPTARLRHIVESKHATGRDKDKFFLASHKDALEQLLKRPD